MATDPFLLDRIRNALRGKGIQWCEKRMFGGNCFMVNDKMLMGTYQGQLMVRLNPDLIDSLTKQPHAEQMVHGGRKMSGFMMVAPEGYDMESDLDFWIHQCLDFNPLAKKSKKKK